MTSSLEEDLKLFDIDDGYEDKNNEEENIQYTTCGDDLKHDLSDIYKYNICNFLAEWGNIPEGQKDNDTMIKERFFKDYPFSIKEIILFMNNATKYQIFLLLEYISGVDASYKVALEHFYKCLKNFFYTFLYDYSIKKSICIKKEKSLYTIIKKIKDKEYLSCFPDDKKLYEEIEDKNTTIKKRINKLLSLPIQFLDNFSDFEEDIKTIITLLEERKIINNVREIWLSDRNITNFEEIKTIKECMSTIVDLLKSEKQVLEVMNNSYNMNVLIINRVCEVINKIIKQILQKNNS